MSENLSKQEYLHMVDIFRDLSHEEIEALGQRTPMKQVPPGTIFYSPDEPTEVLFILKEGRVRLYHLSPDGRMLTIAMLEQGTVFGEMALLGQRLYNSYAEATAPCLLCLMSREDVKNHLLGDPRIAFRVAEMLGARLLTAESRLSDMAFKPAPERVATALVQLSHERRSWHGRDTRREVHCTHEELANVVGVHRETVTKILNDFRQQNLVELRRGKIILLDMAKLGGRL
jgi:CRP-like cAMP-binding protein